MKTVLNNHLMFLINITVRNVSLRLEVQGGPCVVGYDGSQKDKEDMF